MHHYELARPFPDENAHLGSVEGELWVRWTRTSPMRHLNRHEAALVLANWRRAAQDEPERFRLYRRA